MQLLSRLVLPTGCGSPGIGPSFHVDVDQPPLSALPVEIPISQVLEPVPVVHQKSVILSPSGLPLSPLRLPVKHRSATDVAGAGPSQDDVDQPTCATVFEAEESTKKTESSRTGIRRLAQAAACAFRANQEKWTLFGIIMGWLYDQSACLLPGYCTTEHNQSGQYLN